MIPPDPTSWLRPASEPPPLWPYILLLSFLVLTFAAAIVINLMDV